MGWSGTMADSDRRRMQWADVRSFVGEVYGTDLHAKRIDSLAGATLGVMQSASLAVAMIGQALAQARGWPGHQACDQAGRSDAEQQRHRRVGELRALGAVSDRR